MITVNILLAISILVSAIISYINFSKKKVEKGTKRKNLILFFCAIAICILSVIGYFIQEKREQASIDERKELLGQVKQLEDKLSSSKNEIISEISFLRDFKNSDINTLGDSIKVGRTIMGVFSILPNKLGSKGFLFDIGHNESSSRVSLYVNEFSDLIFRVLGEDGTVYSIKVPNDVNKFTLGKVYLIYADYGISKDYSFMRLFLNRKEMGTLKYSSKINFPIEPIKKQLHIGTDIMGSFGGRFYFMEQIIWNNPFPTNERIKIMDDVIKAYNIEE